MVFTKINEKKYKITISPELTAELNYETRNAFDANWVLSCSELFYSPILIKPNGFVKEQAVKHIISACVNRAFNWFTEAKSVQKSCPDTRMMTNCRLSQMAAENGMGYIVNIGKTLEEKVESAFLKITEENIDGCGSKAETMIRIDLRQEVYKTLTPQQATEVLKEKLHNIKKKAVELDQCLDTDDMISKAIQEMESEYPVDITVIYPYEVTF